MSGDRSSRPANRNLSCQIPIEYEDPAGLSTFHDDFFSFEAHPNPGTLPASGRQTEVEMTEIHCLDESEIDLNEPRDEEDVIQRPSLLQVWASRIPIGWLRRSRTAAFTRLSDTDSPATVEPEVVGRSSQNPSTRDTNEPITSIPRTRYSRWSRFFLSRFVESPHVEDRSELQLRSLDTRHAPTSHNDISIPDLESEAPTHPGLATPSETRAQSLEDRVAHWRAQFLRRFQATRESMALTQQRLQDRFIAQAQADEINQTQNGQDDPTPQQLIFFGGLLLGPPFFAFGTFLYLLTPRSHSKMRSWGLLNCIAFLLCSIFKVYYSDLNDAVAQRIWQYPSQSHIFLESDEVSGPGVLYDIKSDLSPVNEFVWDSESVPPLFNVETEGLVDGWTVRKSILNGTSGTPRTSFDVFNSAQSETPLKLRSVAFGAKGRFLTVVEAVAESEAPTQQETLEDEFSSAADVHSSQNLVALTFSCNKGNRYLGHFATVTIGSLNSRPSDIYYGIVKLPMSETEKDYWTCGAELFDLRKPEKNIVRLLKISLRPLP